MDKPSAILPAALEQFRVKDAEPGARKNELGQQAFLDLMVTQLKNQDPFKPMESGEFLGQIAQFSTVHGITELQQSFATLATSLQSSQALQASTMVGRDVVIPRSTFTLRAGQTVPVSAILPATAGAVTVTINDAAGQVVRQVQLGMQDAGTLRFEWDGLRNDGLPAAPGTYGVRIDAAIDGKTQGLSPAVRARVDSVSLDRTGLAPTLNVDGHGPVAMSEVIEIL
jgi:flagellar basal-body rod modification protein FlgD